MKKSVYSMCGMCSVRCPIKVESENNKITWIEGNQHLLQGAMCAKGSAAAALVEDSERPQQPLIREGERGSGRWKEVSWDTALDYVAEKMKKIKDEHGPESVVLSSRGGPWQDLYKSFIHAFGSPNYTNHDSTCGRNTHHASLSVNGVGRKGFSYDIKNAQHLVLFGRNMFSALCLEENLQTLDMLDAGGKLTYVDVRQTMTGLKATRFMQVRPGTDYALALGMIHQIIDQDAYDKEFIHQHVTGFDELCRFIEPYTPAWAAKECGIREKAIINFVNEVKEEMPKVIFHPGWNFSRYHDSFYASRALHILNVLMGNIEQEGGLLIPKGPIDCGVQGLRHIDIAKPDIKRADGVGWKYSHFDEGPGLAHLFFEAMETSQPYPLKAWIAMRHDPLSAMPDPEAQKKAFDNLDLLVSIDTHYSEFGWYSDVILPECTFLERDNALVTQLGSKPRFMRRQKALDIENDTKPSWQIFKSLAERLGMDDYFPFESMEEYWQWQLQPTGYQLSDFDEKGFINLTEQPIAPDPQALEGQFPTPSGKIEIISNRLTEAGLPSLKEYVSPPRPPKGKFRMISGRNAVHSHGHTINNPLLNELMPSNTLWINDKPAKQLGIAHGDLVDVIAEDESYAGTIRANVVDYIHKEAIYLLHGFGKQVAAQTRSYGVGVSDQKLMRNKLGDWGEAGGAMNLCQTFVTVRKSVRNSKRRVDL